MLAKLAQRFRLLLRGELDLAKDRLLNGPDMDHQRALLDIQLAEVKKSVGEEIRFQGGLQHAKWLKTQSFADISEATHRSYSQFGEDGVIQYLLQHVPIENDLFIEFGVEDYRESNTRFLLEKDNWRGVIADSSDEASHFLKRSHLQTRHSIDFIQSFVTAENINDLFAPYAGDIGLLSIDVDGVDYYLWEALTVVSPRIVVIEYQPNFGPDLKISTPYRPDFQRRQHHYSNICYGASLAALTYLANRKSYALVGTAGNHNAFFIRRDVLGELVEKSPKEVYSELRARDSMDESGEWTFLSTLNARQKVIASGLVTDVVTGIVSTFGEAIEGFTSTK